MDEKLQRLLGDAVLAARLRWGLTKAKVARKVGLKPAVYAAVVGVNGTTGDVEILSAVS